jgi:hypothetical protein
VPGQVLMSVVLGSVTYAVIQGPAPGLAVGPEHGVVADGTDSRERLESPPAQAPTRG